MSSIMLIAKTEFLRMFRSLLAWSALAVMLFILGMVTVLYLGNYIEELQPALMSSLTQDGVTKYVMTSSITVGALFLLVVPLLTMGAIAEERQRFTIVLLRSAPINTWQIVLGKYLALVWFIAVFVALLMLQAIFVGLGTELDWGLTFTAYLGLFLLLSSFAAAGLFFSSIASHMVVAAMLSYGLLLFLYVLLVIGQSPANPTSLLIYLSNMSHFSPFIEGVIDTQDLAYFTLFAGLFLSMTAHSLDNQRLQG